MSDTTRRRFTLLDVMILVAVTALAFAAARVAWGATIRAFQGDSRNQERAYPDAFGWFALVESVGLIPLFLSRPRPPVRRLARQPGMVASVAVASTFGFLAVGELAVAVGAWLLSRPGFLDTTHVIWHLSSPLFIGPAVAACWLSQVLGWGWRPEPNWPDRLGRFWGVVWIALAFIVQLLRAFRY
jgi:hypothetical protein